MLPILFQIGPFSFRTFNIFIAMAFLAAGLVFWRKGREEHYDESIFFDGFLIAVITGFIMARLGFVFIRIDQFGLDLLKWFDVFSYPGLSGLFGAVGSTAALYRFARKQKWDTFEVLDFWVLSLSLALSFLWVGALFDGVGFGNPTGLPWGVIFPGVLEKHHPTQIYAALLYVVLFFSLSRLEYTYRLFEWYKAKRKSAQSGFLFCVFLIAHGFINLMLSLIMPATWEVAGIDIADVIHVLIVVFGIVMLFIRSGRAPFFRK